MTRKEFYTPVPNKRCIVCDVDLGTSKKVQLHCEKDRCIRGWLLYMIDSKTEEVDGCHIWKGCNRKGNVAYQALYAGIGPKGRKDLRVLDVLNPEVNSLRRNWENLCGTEHCVHPLHNRVYVAKHMKPGTLDRAKLPVEPLKRALERHRAEKKWVPPRITRGVEDCITRGDITVSYADEICIDVLGVHPYAVYGEDFYAA